MTDGFLSDLAARRRFGMKPGLDGIRSVCAALGDPQKRFRAVHVAGTNGKGAVCAVLDACLRQAAPPGSRIGRYTSPHLVKVNERFFLDGRPVDDGTLARAAAKVAAVAPADLTFFEALTAVAFLVYAEAGCARAVLETGLGGRLDATCVCEPELCVITRIGLDHCDWLGDTVEKIAAEKAGIVKPGVPVVLGRNAESVRSVVEARAKEAGAPFYYAPDLASEDEIPEDFSLAGTFNRENAVTAIAALKALSFPVRRASPVACRYRKGFARVVWPGRFQRVGDCIVDGAHNPPAAKALARALDSLKPTAPLSLVAGFCGDKDVDEVLRILKPRVARGFAVRTNNPRSLSAEATAARMASAGIPSVACASLKEALAQARAARGTSPAPSAARRPPASLVCGSLFLAGEALKALDAYPWPTDRFDAAELLRV